LSGIVAERVRDIIRGICKENEVEIIKGHISQDHIHLFVSVPPHLAISKLVQYLKGKSSYKMLQENKSLSKLFWGRHLWGRGSRVRKKFFCKGNFYKISVFCFANE